jgi:hypothetical protein
VLGFGAYTWLLQVTSAAAVGTHAFVNPVVAVGLGLLVGDEVFSMRTIVAGGLVLGAVLLIWKSSSQDNATRERKELLIPSGNRARRGAREGTGQPASGARRVDPSVPSG